MDYEAVYLPKNNFIKAETLSTEDFIVNFYPFEQPDFKKKGMESAWNISGDRTMMALAMTFSNKTLAATTLPCWTVRLSHGTFNRCCLVFR